MILTNDQTTLLAVKCRLIESERVVASLMMQEQFLKSQLTDEQVLEVTRIAYGPKTDTQAVSKTA